MTLEDLIYTRLCASESLTRRLAAFDGQPAIFYHRAPDDTDFGWNPGVTHYPRVDFVVDFQANPERHTSGVMTLNIWCSTEGISPYELELMVRNLFQDVFITSDNGPPFSLSWLRSDAFIFGGKYPESASHLSPNTGVDGLTLLFDVFAFPCQETTDPDPVLCMNQFIKKWLPKSIVIGWDTLPTFQTATAESPIFYFRPAVLRGAERTYTVTWMEGELVGHLFAPENVRTVWLKTVTDALAGCERVRMADGSPMFLRGVAVDSSVDALVSGQLRVRVRYGIPRRKKYAHPLVKIHRNIR